MRKSFVISLIFNVIFLSTIIWALFSSNNLRGKLQSISNELNISKEIIERIGNIEDREREIIIRETEINRRERNITERERSIINRERNITERERNINRQEGEANSRLGSIIGESIEILKASRIRNN